MTLPAALIRGAFVLLAGAVLYSHAAIAAAQAQPVPDRSPSITLAASVKAVEAFVARDAKLSYKNKFLSAVRYEYIEATPRRGLAWVHYYANKTPSLGGEISVYHYMDGTILEVGHGP